jgi:hypothetical protein
VVADASNAAVTEGFEMVATYDLSPGQRNNRIPEINVLGGSQMPYSAYYNLTISTTGPGSSSRRHIGEFHWVHVLAVDS